MINITSDTNILIEKSKIKNYVFNVKESIVNILSINEPGFDVSYEINIFKGNVSFSGINFHGNVNINVNLNKKDSSVLIHNSVIAIKKTKYDITVNHNAKKTISNIYNNGITKDYGTIIFNVSSLVPKKSTNCYVNQDSKIITLNKTNDNEINPVLLIDEYESEARHAAFIGNFDNDKLFYLMSRGLSKKDATNLLIDGLLIGTLDVCFNEKEILKKKFEKEWR